MFNESVAIKVRGGKTMKLNVSAQSVIPHVDIKQNEFKFGGETKLRRIDSLNICHLAADECNSNRTIF